LIKVLKRGAVLAGYPTELWTLPRVRDVIAQRFGRRYNEAHVSRLLKGLGFSCQRPTGRAVQRDEATIRQWKQQRWPALKKTPKNKAKPSSSSTSPD
jgi:transposase